MVHNIIIFLLLLYAYSVNFRYIVGCRLFCRTVVIRGRVLFYRLV